MFGFRIVRDERNEDEREREDRAGVGRRVIEGVVTGGEKVGDFARRHPVIAATVGGAIIGGVGMVVSEKLGGPRMVHMNEDGSPGESLGSLTQFIGGAVIGGTTGFSGAVGAKVGIEIMEEHDRRRILQAEADLRQAEARREELIQSREAEKMVHPEVERKVDDETGEILS